MTVAGVAVAPAASAVGGLGRVVATGASDSLTQKSIAASCPVGKRVVGGGGEIIGGGGQVVLTQLRPVQDGAGGRYVVAGREDETGFTGNWSLRAYAVCADPLPGLQIVAATSATSSDQTRNLFAFCPSGTNMLGLGVQVNNGSGQVHITAEANFFFDPPIANNVAAIEDSNGFAGNWSLTSYAVCAVPVPGLQIVYGSSAASSAGKSATVTCPPGTRVHGAGPGVSAATNAILSHLVVDRVVVDPALNQVTIGAVEDETGTAGDWTVGVAAVCAQ
ncbi:hypothetical protein ETD83_02740 [Actinomadura soli]|uniref:Uncharacterized protein n=1 Tax=Actinomadura soli TaxID=2508997 RepID=A0A5C4JJ38_9ACTN|nr:hypothetical protein [Actinomadura soli]TMR06946.1 hypothetical protein ETD83_02740 [Actinomadura soli]